MTTRRVGLAVAVIAWLAACGGGTSATDGGGDTDARTDLGTSDLGAPDAGCGDDDSDGHRALACGGDDCDDADANRYPGNLEVCDATGHDEDCEPSTLGPDADSDTFVSDACCNTQPDGHPLCGTDCDDAERNIHPGAPESCNGVDDDCNGSTDEGLVATAFYPDCDGDGFGDAAATARMACAAPHDTLPCAGTPGTGAAWVASGTDCNDVARMVHPGALTPCDCVPGATPWDADGDGHTTSACGEGDCDDARADVYDGAPELCDGLQNDCTDTAWVEEDADSDGYTSTASTCAGGPLPGGDCDDAVPHVHEGSPDCMADGIDDDCDGTDGDWTDAECHVVGVVRCGTSPSATCSGSTPVCCAMLALPLLIGSCAATAASCTPPAGAMSCDGPEDCSTGQACCITDGSPGQVGACGSARCLTQACHTASDCVPGGTCELYHPPLGGTIDTGSYVCVPPVSPVSPGAVVCGAPPGVSCPLPSDHCCVRAGESQSCLPAATTCPTGTFGTGTFACDGPEDCSGSTHCCLDMPTATTAASTCSTTTCSQVCHAAADCPAGQVCHPYMPSGISTTMGLCS